jgi:hypothetical protein
VQSTGNFTVERLETLHRKGEYLVKNGNYIEAGENKPLSKMYDPSQKYFQKGESWYHR